LIFLLAMATTSSRGRGRQRSTGSATALIDDLTSSIEKLIQENKTLKREVSRLESSGDSQMSTRSLASLQRKAAQALGTKASNGRSTRRRRVTDPDVLERRRQALAKARQALAAKRAAGGS
jgi:cell division septum initiation protein DivIVA